MMIRRLRSRVSSAHLISVLALFVALGGAAYALQSNSVRSKHIKDNAVKFRDLAGVKSWKKLAPVSAEAATAGAARIAADPVALAKRGTVTIYGKCFRRTSDDVVFGSIFLRTSANGAVFRSGADQVNRLDTTTDESVRSLPGAANTGNNASALSSGQFDSFSILAANHRLALSGLAHVAAKNGTPPGGDAPFGSGDRCSFSGFVIG